MELVGHVVSVQIGAVQPLAADASQRTGYVKRPCAGPVRVTRLGLDGDEHAAVEVHGGPDRAVLAFCVSHYELFRAEHPGHTFVAGAFAENLTVDGLDETSVCIGDRFRVGTVELEVSLPRTPCGLLSLATGIDGLFERVDETGRSGWLHRVISEGVLSAGDEITRLAHPHSMWSVDRAARVMARLRAGDREAVADGLELAGIGALAERWRVRLRELAG